MLMEFLVYMPIEQKVIIKIIMRRLFVLFVISLLYSCGGSDDEANNAVYNPELEYQKIWAKLYGVWIYEDPDKGKWLYTIYESFSDANYISKNKEELWHVDFEIITKGQGKFTIEYKEEARSVGTHKKERYKSLFGNMDGEITVDSKSANNITIGNTKFNRSKVSFDQIIGKWKSAERQGDYMIVGKDRNVTLRHLENGVPTYEGTYPLSEKEKDNPDDILMEIGTFGIVEFISEDLAHCYLDSDFDGDIDWGYFVKEQ